MAYHFYEAKIQLILLIQGWRRRNDNKYACCKVFTTWYCLWIEMDWCCTDISRIHIIEWIWPYLSGFANNSKMFLLLNPHVKRRIAAICVTINTSINQSINFSKKSIKPSSYYFSVTFCVERKYRFCLRWVFLLTNALKWLKSWRDMKKDFEKKIMCVMRAMRTSFVCM